MRFYAFIAIFLAAGELDALDSSSWKYDLQGEWSTSYKQCIGLRQSPINIETFEVIEKTSEACLKWSNYHDNHPNMTIVYDNDCVTVKADWAGIPTISNGAATDEYKLIQFHFHLSQKDYDGSEHSFNSFKRPMEMHFVHIKNSFSTLADALASKDEDAIIVIARLLKISETSNEGLQPIINAVENGETLTSTDLKLASIMDCEASTYYSYLGSLSSPECNENVRWIVFEGVHTLSRHQIEVLRSVKYNGVQVHPNYRLQQPVNKRPIYYHNC